MIASTNSISDFFFGSTTLLIHSSSPTTTITKRCHHRYHRHHYTGSRSTSTSTVVRLKQVTAATTLLAVFCVATTVFSLTTTTTTVTVLTTATTVRQSSSRSASHRRRRQWLPHCDHSYYLHRDRDQDRWCTQHRCWPTYCTSDDRRDDAPLSSSSSKNNNTAAAYEYGLTTAAGMEPTTSSIRDGSRSDNNRRVITNNTTWTMANTTDNESKQTLLWSPPSPSPPSSSSSSDTTTSRSTSSIHLIHFPTLYTTTTTTATTTDDTNKSMRHLERWKRYCLGDGGVYFDQRPKTLTALNSLLCREMVRSFEDGAVDDGAVDVDVDVECAILSTCARLEIIVSVDLLSSPVPSDSHPASYNSDSAPSAAYQFPSHDSSFSTTTHSHRNRCCALRTRTPNAHGLSIPTYHLLRPNIEPRVMGQRKRSRGGRGGTRWCFPAEFRMSEAMVCSLFEENRVGMVEI